MKKHYKPRVTVLTKRLLISSSGRSRCASSKSHRLCCLIQLFVFKRCDVQMVDHIHNWVSGTKNSPKFLLSSIFQTVGNTTYAWKRTTKASKYIKSIFTLHQRRNEPFLYLLSFLRFKDRAMQTCQLWPAKPSTVCDTLLKSITAKVFPVNVRHRETSLLTTKIEK